MNLNDYFKLGHVIKTHGLKGEILIKKNIKKVCKSLINKFIYINKNGDLIPFKIKNLTPIKNNLKIELEDIDNQNSD